MRGLVKWVKDQEQVLLTDTTYRDAHQSLLATRLRTHDILNIAEQTQNLLPDLFSMEMWVSATLMLYQLLKEDPWERLIQLRKKVPNTLFQMLFRGSNAVGYKNYPDNVIEETVKARA